MILFHLFFSGYTKSTLVNLLLFGIFLTYTGLELILWTGNSAALLLQGFLFRMLVSDIDFSDVNFVWEKDGTSFGWKVSSFLPDTG